MKSSMMKKGIVAMIVALLFILTPLRASAHDAYFLQVVINTNTFQYEGNVVEDSASMFNAESKHIEAGLGDFSSIRDKVTNFTLPIADPNNCGNSCYKESTTAGSSSMPFTFAPHEDGGGWFSSKKKNNATEDDVNRAYLIKETLIPGLNDALRVLNNGEAFKTMKDFLDMSGKLSTGGTVNGWTVKYAADGTKTNKDEKTGLNDSDYVTISKGTETYKFPYRMVKGYKSSGDPLYSSSRNMSDDTEYLTWSQLMYQAQYSYVAKGITSKEAYQMSKPGALESAIVGLFGNIFNGIRNLLGLYSTNDLVYNEGIRGSSAYHYGAMPTAWASNVDIFHWIFQAIAWSLIALALMKALIKKNFSSINPAMRISLIESVQDLLLTGLILAFSLPLINMFLMFNTKIVAIFGATAPDFSDVNGLNNYSNGLAGIILQFFYLVIGIWLNFTYIIRGITIAVLVAMAPLFIVTLAFGGQWKSLFGTWMKELISNIFLQSFHAFIFAFFATFAASSRGIESMVVAFAIMPLTELFRSLIMGQSGGMAGQLGLNTLKAGAGMVGNAASAGKSVGQKRTEGGGDGKASTSKEGSKDGKGVTSTVGSDKTMAGSSEKLASKSAGGSSSSGGTVGSQEESFNTKMSKEMPIDLAHSSSAGIDKVTQHRGTDGNASNLEQKTNSAIKADQKAAKGSKFDRVVKGVGGTAKAGASVGSHAWAGTKVAAGVGMSLAFGGIDSEMNKMGQKLAGSGINKFKESGSAVVGGATGVVKDGYDFVKEKARNKFDPQATPGTFAKDKQGALIEGELLARQKPNDDIEVHRDGAVLQHNGLMRANDDADGNAVFTYDTQNSNMSREDKANIQNMVNLYKESKTDPEKEAYMKQQGIERVSMNGHGNIQVAYNKTGKEKLGIKSVQTLGDGRVVETKRSHDPMATRMTLSVPQMPVKQAQTTGNTQGKGQQKNGNQSGNQNNGNNGNKNGNRNNTNRNANTVGGQRTGGGQTN